MIDLGLSDEYLTGFNARCKDLPFDKDETEEWKMGWQNADQNLKREGGCS